VVLFVLLRLGLGCHFFYEGVWKTTHPEFSAEGFLLQAKGPAAGLFHAMIPDLEGRERLKRENCLNAQPVLDAWKEARKKVELSPRYDRHYRAAMAELTAFRGRCAAGLLQEVEEKYLKEVVKALDALLLAKTAERFEGLDQRGEATGLVLLGFRAKLDTLLTAAKLPNTVRAKYLGDLDAVSEKVEAHFALLDQRRAASEAIYCEHADKLDATLDKNRAAMVEYINKATKRVEDGESVACPDNVRQWVAAMAQIEQNYRNALATLVANDLVVADRLLPEGASEEEIAEARKAAVEAAAPAVELYFAEIGEKALEKDLIDHEHNRLQLPTDAGANVILQVTELIPAAYCVDSWNDLRETAVTKYGLDEAQTGEVRTICRRYKDSLRAWLADKHDEIVGHFGALDRLKAAQSGGNNGAEHQKKNLYDEKMKLRGEVGGWLSEIEEMDAGYRAALWGVLTDDQKKYGELPEPTTRVDLINFMVTFALTAIGLCLLLGLFTRPAAFGGGCFMLFVVLTQPAWPTIYPHDPPVVGHALLINKDFIEMLALFTVATTAAGRWCGLDYFVENYIVNLFRKPKDKKTDSQEEGRA